MVRAIEGITESEYSHCGVVVRRNNQYYVKEAYGIVKDTPLSDWVLRGRGYMFSAYRLKDEHSGFTKRFLESLKKYIGLPYDSRYELDDEKIYCSELVYKAFLDATGKEIGKLQKLVVLYWQPFESIIRKYESGPPPLDRKMITPLELTKSEHLKEL